MAVVTPCGMQIRIDPREVFAMISILRRGSTRRRSVLGLLWCCDGIENIPNAIAYLAGLVAICLASSIPWAIPCAVIGGQLLGQLLRRDLAAFSSVVLVVRGWLTATMYVRQSVAIVLAAMLGGWIAVVLWIGSSLASPALDLLFAAKTSSVMQSYLLAWRLLLKGTGIQLTREMLLAAVEDGSWEKSWEEYAEAMPISAVRLVAADLELAGLS